MSQAQPPYGFGDPAGFFQVEALRPARSLPRRTRKLRVQISPRIMNVAVPAPQHSPIFGHRALLADGVQVQFPHQALQFPVTRHCRARVPGTSPATAGFFSASGFSICRIIKAFRHGVDCRAPDDNSGFGMTDQRVRGRVGDSDIHECIRPYPVSRKHHRFESV